jgi:hypothetical protein
VSPLDPLPTVTELPWPPGDTVVLAVAPPLPVVTVVEFPLWPVTTWQGLPFPVVTPVPPLPLLTATLSAQAGMPTRDPTINATAVIGMRIVSSKQS